MAEFFLMSVSYFSFMSFELSAYVLCSFLFWYGSFSLNNLSELSLCAASILTVIIGKHFSICYFVLTFEEAPLLPLNSHASLGGES